MTKEYEAVLVVAGDDLKNLNRTCSYLLKFTCCTRIVVITNDIHDALNKVANFEFDKVHVIDENTILKPFSKKEISNYKVGGFPARYFWYYQQFLKILYARYTKSEYYLIWDADTIPLTQMNFFDIDGKIFLTEGNEHLHQEYRNTNETLLGDVELPSKSFISQHMMVNKNLMIDLIESIECKFNLPFYDAVLTNLNSVGLSQFSEYELYASFVLRNSVDYKVKKRNWFRFGASILGFTPSESGLKSLSSYYEYAAFEKFDKGILKQIRAWLLHFTFVVKFKTKNCILMLERLCRIK